MTWSFENDTSAITAEHLLFLDGSHSILRKNGFSFGEKTYFISTNLNRLLGRR